jgi:ElaB/YqjD/DUF883 family membrane-anchored ribosome-binding protein
MTTRDNHRRPPATPETPLNANRLSKSLRSIRESAQMLEEQLLDLDEDGGFDAAEWKDKFVKTKDAVVSGTKDVALKTDEYVTSYPWVAAGICAGLGVLTGMMISRR